MSRSCTTPLAAIAKGALAGAIGTVAMTAYQLAVIRPRGSEPSDVPGQVGKRIIEGVLQRQVPEERMGLLNNVVHWLYGTTWGAVYGLVQASTRGRPLRGGLAFGAAVWGASLIELPALKLAPPVWEYPPKEAALDLSYHAAYGLGVGAAYAALER